MGQDKLQEITLQESLNESDDQRKSANDNLQGIEEKIKTDKEELKDLYKKIDTKMEEKTMLENELLVISQDFIYLEVTKEALFADANKNTKDQNDLDIKVKNFEYKNLEHNNLIEDLKRFLSEINAKRDLVHVKIKEQSDSFNSLKED